MSSQNPSPPEEQDSDVDADQAVQTDSALTTGTTTTNDGGGNHGGATHPHPTGRPNTIDP